jgi:DNA-directed RNA polymerase specialized sigma24 family protein
MRPQRERRRSAPFVLHSVDCHGRSIAPGVLSAAIEIGPRAVQYAEKLLGDPAVAISLLEEAAATVTRVIQTKIKVGEPEVENLPAYLFRTFLRFVNGQIEPALCLEEAVANGDEPAVDDTASLHAGLLLNAVLETCDTVGRAIALRRLEGFSWDEIADQLQISSHAARVRFSRALKHARTKLNRRKPKGLKGIIRAALQEEGKTRARKRLLRAGFSSAGEEAFVRALPEP